MAVLAVAAGGIYLARPRGSGPDPKLWEAKSAAAFRPLVSDVPDLVTAAREWLTGVRATEQFRLVVDRDRRDLDRTLDRVTALKPSPKVPETGELYERSAQLYVEVVRSYDAMLATPAGDLRNQVDLLARRIRELADRVFDRGQAAIAPYLGKEQSKDVEIRLPEEVPIWPDEGLAAGPPLDDQPAPPASSPPLRQRTRPEQTEAAWRVDVRAAGAPSERELRAAIDRKDRGLLQAMARRFVDAAERLRGRPDPKGQRERGAILRLALLVDADAARAAQAATFSAPPLRGVANGMVIIGAALTQQAGL